MSPLPSDQPTTGEMNERLPLRPRPGTSFPLYDHMNPGTSRSPLAVVQIEGLLALWTEADPSLRESIATAITSSCVAGNATELCREGISSDVWGLTAAGDQEESSGPVYPTWALVLMGLLAGCTSLVTVSGNLIVILSFFLDRTIRQPTNYFIASLAVSDLVIGAVSMPFYTVYLLTGQHWPLGEILCDLWLSVDYTVCLCSIYTVFCITIDRFCSVRIPAKYRNWRTERKVLVVVALTWVVPALVFFPSVFGWQCFVGKRTVPKGKCYVQYMEDALFNCFLQVGYFWVTLCAMCSLYGGIYRVALNLQQKSDLKQKTSKLVSSAGQKMARIGSGVVGGGGGGDDHPSRKEDAPNNDTNGRGRRIVNNGGRDRSSRGGDGGGGGGCVTNDRREREEEAEEDSASSPDYPGIVYLDEKPDERHLSGSFIHHVDGAMTPDVEEGREKEREREDGNDGTRNLVDVSPVVQSANNARHPRGNRSRDRKTGDKTGSRSSPNLFTGRALPGSLVSKTRKAVFIERSAGGCCDNGGEHSSAHFEVRWLSEDDLESRLFEENVRLLVRSHRIDSSTTDSAGEDPPGSPVWKKRDSPTEHCSLLVAMEDGRSLQYQSMLKQETSEDARLVRRNDSRLNYNENNSDLSGGGHNRFEAVKGCRRVFARIRGWREGTSRHRSSPDEVQTPPAPLQPQSPGACSRMGHALNNGEIELKHLGGRETTMDFVTTTTGVSDHPYCNQSSLQTQGSSGAPFQSVLRRLRKFDDSQNRDSTGEAARKCKRVNRARKALRTITVILGAFVLCWTPWHVLSMIIGFCPKGIVCVTPVLYDISYWLCYLNSPLNPLCYALANQQFKKTFARILKFDWHRT